MNDYDDQRDYPFLDGEPRAVTIIKNFFKDSVVAVGHWSLMTPAFLFYLFSLTLVGIDHKLKNFHRRWRTEIDRENGDTAMSRQSVVQGADSLGSSAEEVTTYDGIEGKDSSDQMGESEVDNEQSIQSPDAEEDDDSIPFDESTFGVEEEIEEEEQEEGNAPLPPPSSTRFNPRKRRTHGRGR